MKATTPSHSRSILHMDLDTFFVSVERLMDRRLHGVPILIGGTGDRGVVAACSYETRTFGVHSGMPMRQARLMCPEALVIRGNSINYMKQSEAVTAIIKEAVPVCEKSSIDEFYADLSGMDRFFGCWQFARELRDRVIHETGLPISFGMSTSKTVSKVATGQAKPSGYVASPIWIGAAFSRATFGTKDSPGGHPHLQHPSQPWCKTHSHGSRNAHRIDGTSAGPKRHVHLAKGTRHRPQSCHRVQRAQIHLHRAHLCKRHHGCRKTARHPRGHDRKPRLPTASRPQTHGLCEP